MRAAGKDFDYTALQEKGTTHEQSSSMWGEKKAVFVERMKDWRGMGITELLCGLSMPLYLTEANADGEMQNGRRLSDTEFEQAVGQKYDEWRVTKVEAGAAEEEECDEEGDEEEEEEAAGTAQIGSPVCRSFPPHPPSYEPPHSTSPLLPPLPHLHLTSNSPSLV